MRVLQHSINGFAQMFLYVHWLGIPANTLTTSRLQSLRSSPKIQERVRHLIYANGLGRSIFKQRVADELFSHSRHNGLECQRIDCPDVVSLVWTSVLVCTTQNSGKDALVQIDEVIDFCHKECIGTLAKVACTLTPHPELK